MNKKGVELPQNVIIISIIVLVVLVVVIAFFAGGTATIGQRIKSLFSAGADDISTSLSFCEQYCQTAQGYNSDATKRASSYCTRFFSIDKDGDGSVDLDSENKPNKYFCKDDLNVPCPGVEELCPSHSN